MPAPTITRPTPSPTKTSRVIPTVRRPVRTARHSLPAHRQASQRHLRVRGALVALEGLVALTAIQGAIFVVPTLPRAWLREGSIAPFSDYTIPALVLGIVCGGSALLALVAIVMRPWLGALASIAAGLLMVGYELVEIAVVGFTPVLYPTQPPAWLQVVYLAAGTTIALLGGYLLYTLARSFRLFPIPASVNTR